MRKHKCRLLTDETIFDKLADDVPSGQYKLFEPSEIPTYLSPPGNRRGQFANTCLLVIATTWNQELDFFGYQPTDSAYCVLTFRDDYDPTQQHHFNKDSQFIFRDIKMDAYTMHLYDPKEHSIQVATGTSLPFLRKAFRLPDAKTGTIDELIKYNTSIYPYSTDAAKQDTQ